MPDIILGIDIGTASAKAIAFDLAGAMVASASQAYPLLVPRPGWVEQDAEQVWQALLRVLREIVGRTTGLRIRALALAAQAGSIILADEAGDPIYPMITWLDRRADDLVAAWRRDGTAERIQQVSGWHPSPGLPLPIIAWLRAERPDLHARVRRYLGVADFLIHRLTGQFASDLSAACEMLLVDAQTGEWSAELCALGGVDATTLATLGWAGRVVGALTPAAASATGLPADTLVVVGGGDQPCACLGMGMLTPGQVMLATGTAWVITSVAASARLEDVPPAMDLGFHVAPGHRLISQFLGGFGATVDWWLQQAWQPPDPSQALPMRDLYRRLDEALVRSAPGSHGLLFTPLDGPSQAPGAAAGGVLSGLQLTHTRSDMARAILEGCGFEVRWALDRLRASGLSIAELWVAGGATASPVWPQILADVTATPIVLADYANWAALGAAALAGWGIGAFPTLEAGIARLRPEARRLTPDASLASLYAGRYAAYRRLAMTIQ